MSNAQTFCATKLSF